MNEHPPPRPFATRSWSPIAAALSSPLLLALALAACQPAPTPPLATATETPAAAAIITPLAISDVAALEAHLQAKGVAFDFEGEQDMEYLDPPGRIYRLAGTDSLEVHVYPDDAAAAAAAARVSPDGRVIVDPAGERVAIQWLGTPYFFRGGPLLVIYVGTEPKTLEALVTAFGAPFAGGPL